MDSADSASPAFYVGHHESNRALPVSTQVVQLVHNSNYDMVTTPITTAHFHSRVLTLLSSHLSNMQPNSPDATGTFATSQNSKPLVIPQLSLEDSNLIPNESISNMVAVTSSWIDLCSPDPLIADVSRQVLALEIAYAAFCGVSFVIIQGPRLHHGSLHGEGVMYYARAIEEVMDIAPYMQIHIWLPMVDNPDLETTEMGDLAPFARPEYLGQSLQAESSKVDLFGTWDAWNVIRTVCKYHSRLFIALSLPKYLPPIAVQTRWHSEPVHILTLDASSFIKNQKGYPVLSKAHQSLIFRFMRLRNPPWILLCDVGPIPGQENIQADGTIAGLEFSSSPTPAEAWQRFGPNVGKKDRDPTPHLSYIRNLQQRQPQRTALERFGVGYQDYLQAPLQPLTVNLESITYEVFEKDPIKYEWYERAITKALKDWVAQKKPTSSGDGRVVLAVVGAGRGPLVTRAIRASVEAGVDIEVWAVEKNPNAFVHLQRKNQTIWGGSVNLVQSDMRSWKGPRRPSTASRTTEGGGTVPLPADIHTPIDIVVSELLGSFGDNELSPECLDGITPLLNPVHGISIPASYSAHLTPVAAPRLYADITNQSVSNPAAPETPYVVMLHAIDYLSTTPPTSPLPSPKNSTQSVKGSPTPGILNELPLPIVKTAWSFSHPNPNIPLHSPPASTISNAHNVRHTRLTFPCRERGLCHGLAGYFETVLYDDVELSTNPVTMNAKSAEMISWFPIYFPLKTPIYVPANSEIVVTMFRQTDNRKVWYEWIVEVFKVDNSSSTPPSHGPAVSMSQSQSQSSAPSSERGSPAIPGSKPGHTGPKRTRVAMSELHSSIKNGCLM
ncbi:hypothetical protein VTO42DRAFT_8981 [Malbranchea cinnamomea]